MSTAPITVSISKSSAASNALLRADASAAAPVLTDIQLSTKLALDLLEERLKAGEKALPECLYKAGKLNTVVLARELGIPAWHRLRFFRDRLDALVEQYCLTPAAVDRYAFADFRVTALNHRAQQLAAAGSSVAERETVLRGLDAAFDWAASLAPGASARGTFAMAALAASVPEAIPEAETMKHLAWAKAVFHDWLENRDLPVDPAAVLRLAVDCSGMRVCEAAAKAGMTNRFLIGLIEEGRHPLTVHYRKIAALEKLLGLPEASLVEAYRRLPAEAPADDVGPDLDADYRLHDWPEAAEAEFRDFEKFRTAPIVPYGMARPPKLLRPKTLSLIRDILNSLYGFWSTSVNPQFSIDPMDVGMGYAVFPRLVHSSWEFTVLRNGTDGTPRALKKWDLEKARHMLRLLDPRTGFITQSPRLADRIVPVRDRDGNYLVSPEDIARVKADWVGACAKAREEYADLRRSQSKVAEYGTDQLASIEAILRLPNPLDAFRMLCTGVRRIFLRAKRDLAGAEAVRDVVLVGLLTQCAFRACTVEQLNLEHLVRDPETGRWWMRVPRELFKNANGPYFRIGRTNAFRPFYERELQDKHGLYDAIEAYLEWARKRVLYNKQDYHTDALIVTVPRKSSGVRRKFVPTEPGRTRREYVTYRVRHLTGKHVAYDPATGKGIKGATRFPTHRFRAILATGVLKLSKGAHPKAEAADAIHDSEETVEVYLRFVPQDRAASLDRTLRTAF
jgi:hypothetical protein